MIPEEKKAAVARGLQDAFGVAEFEDIRRLARGHNLVFRIAVRGTPYLLKVILYTQDATCHFTCMRAAAEAGLAPQVRYSSIEDRIAITDFVEETSFPVADALVRIPAALRALHALPPFPGREHHLNTSCIFLMHKGAAVDGFFQQVQAAKVFAEKEWAELMGWYAQLAGFHADSDMVSSHNDLFKPDNMLFDGQRLWLVDWEAAFRNDRYADLAVVANLVVTNDAEEAVFLREYFGHAPDAYQLARFFLMQQVAHMFYAMAFLMLGSAGGAVNLRERAPAFGDFQQRMWAGEINLKDNASKILFGRVHWEWLVRNMRQARLEEALRIVSARHASA